MAGDGAVFFDIDGVLLREQGLAEIGYSYLIQSVRENRMDVSQEEYLRTLSSEECHSIQQIRPQLKGYHPVAKIAKLEDLFGKADNIDKEELTRKQMSLHRKFISTMFSKQEYIMPGGLELVCSLVNNYKLYTLTANEVGHTGWLLNYMGVSDKFTGILGFSVQDQHITNKYDMLQEFLSKEGSALSRSKSFVIGDGIPDVKAAKKVGITAIGVYSNKNHRQDLLKAGADYVFAQSTGYPEIQQLLTSLA